MSGFSNRTGVVPRGVELRAALDRSLAYIDRMAALPAGHPEILRAWGLRERVPVLADVLEVVADGEYEAFERELAEHLEGV